MYCSKPPKREDNEHTMYEANRAIGKDNSILFAERSKKRGRKRQKAQSALVVYVSCPTGVKECFLTLRQTHFFTHNWYAQDN